jgi:DNA replication and repair protein RecF
MPRFAVTRLTLTDFRNYASTRIATDASLVALTGANGAGKTNLLEAISLLAPGRGLRGASFDELARTNGGGGWAVAANISSPDGSSALGTGWTRPAGESDSQARQVKIDGAPQKSSGMFGEYMRLLWLTPAMDRLFAGPASDRRRFFDRLTAAFDPAHGSRVLAFEKLMRERNLLLAGDGFDAAWMAGLETQMAEAAAAISAARLLALEALRSHITEARNGSAFPWAELALAGELEARIGDVPAVQVEQEYRRILADSRKLDRTAGRTLRGPHRSDFAVTHGPKSIAAERCSTGEQKALLIGLILAQARAVKDRSGAVPVLLLDEIAAHLDAHRRDGLFATLEDLGAQAWMTGTDAALFETLKDRAAHMHVDSGMVMPI